MILATEVQDAPETEEEEALEHWANSVANGLEATGLIEIVDTKYAPGQIHLMGRVKRENEKKWVHGPIKSLLFRLRGVAEVFFGKEFFLKDDHMVYGWVTSFGARNLETVVYAISEALADASPKVEVVEAPMLGSGTPEGSLGKGPSPGRKGAQIISG